MVEQLRINILVNSVIGIEKFTLCREKIPFCPTQSGHGTSTLPFTSFSVFDTGDVVVHFRSFHPVLGPVTGHI